MSSSSSWLFHSNANIYSLLWSGGALLVSTTAAYWWIISRPPFVNIKEDLDHAYYLNMAQQIRQSLAKPCQSRFRVVALLLVESLPNQSLQIIVGVNQEPSGNIQNSLCAERAAFSQLHLYSNPNNHQKRVRHVYIVTDATVPVPPGLLCREYMYGHVSTTPETRIVLQSSTTNQNDDAIQITTTTTTTITTLGELYPHPGLYVTLSIEEQLQLGRSLSVVSSPDPVELETITSYPVLWAQLPREISQHLDHSHLQQLVTAAWKATQDHARLNVHAIQYGAAALLFSNSSNDSSSNEPRPKSNISIVAASQRKALEYGASQDAVCQLLPQLLSLSLSQNQQPTVLLLVQVDQFGIPHAPYAAARSLLVEHGLGSTQCLITSTNNSFQAQWVTAAALAPQTPEFRT